ncbi:MAG: GNAT family N-acetyltransferase [Chloroflexota bacterium]|nr:GNAT family N-acetyltransferase [Chloroflexota bacterium]
MTIEVKRHSGGARDFFQSAEIAFGEHFEPDDLPVFEPLFEADRALAAHDGKRMVGNATIISFELTVPGGTLPVAGVSAVGVQPTHRRRGILRQMMRRQLDEVHERGEPLAALWASEGSIYQRFGYGLATVMGSIDVERSRSAFRVPRTPSGRIRFVSRAEAGELFPPLYERMRTARVGFFERSPAFWDALFYDPERWRRGGGPAFFVVHEVDGAVDGYARYRIHDDWDLSGSKSRLVVMELMAENAAAHLDLWRFLFDVDLIATVVGQLLAVDDPLLLAMAEPRRLRFTIGDALWLRIVDVEGALGGRRYHGSGRVIIGLRDEFCPWNAGRWALDVGDGSAVVERTGEAAELDLDVTDLAAIYLGAFTVAQLLAAGRGRELGAGSAARLDGLLRSDRAPWCPAVF